MAPHIRTIKHEFFLDEDLAELPPLTRLAFVGMWTLADREGRLEDRPKRIQAELFPYERVIDMEAIVASLAAGGFLRRYTVDAKCYLAITKFAKHQRPNIREPASQLPPPPPVSHEHARAESVQARAGFTTSRRGAALEGKGREGDPDPDPDPSRDPTSTEPSTPPSGRNGKPDRSEPDAPIRDPDQPLEARPAKPIAHREAIAVTNGSGDHPTDSIGLSGELMQPAPRATNPPIPHARTQKLRTETPDRLRPDNPANIVQCLKVAVERAYPARGMWTPHRFAYSDAQRFWDSIKSDPRAVETIERRIGLYIKSEIGHKSGWSLSGFIDGFNQLVNTGGVTYAKIG